MLKKLKQVTLSSLKTLGVFTLAQNSKWRQNRLLILAYHGISQEDEHLWNPDLFMSPDYFKSRMELLKKRGCSILSLGEAIQRLYANDLPKNSVALTFDDGYYDLYKVALPILKEFNLPATLYLTTSYVYYNLPYFDAICSYVLWKGRNTALDLRQIIGQDEKFDLSIDAARVAAYDHLIGFASKRKLSEEEKNALAKELSRRLKIDYDALRAKRILHLLNPEEVRQLAAEGIDIQLHTHHHRSPSNRDLFSREIEENRNSIMEMTGSWAGHFCYPNGNFNDDLIAWLEEMKITTATTCDPGLATHNSNPLLLPRLIDTTPLSLIEFEGWLTGVSSALPRRRRTYNLGISEQEMGIAIGTRE